MANKVVHIEKSKFWHSLWIDNGRRGNGPVATLNERLASDRLVKNSRYF